MKKTCYKLLLLLLAGSLLASCRDKEEDLDISGLQLGGETWVKTPMDDWLTANFVQAYNIEVKYRFDRYEVSLNRTLVPPKESKVIPVMEAVKKTWIEPYELEAGATFIKTLSPKQFVLVGSPQFNTNGTIVLGTAEGGRKIVLFKVNDFDKKNKFEVKQMLHTIQHEFGHILHQNIMYPVEYKTVTTDYTASWNDYPLADARSRGYITEYARSSPNEDFVEMIATMLVEGKSNFDAMVESAPETARPLFRRKEQLVVRYFKEAWNIDFYALQTRTQAAINGL